MMPSEPTDSTAPTRPRGFFVRKWIVDKAALLTGWFTLWSFSACIGLFVTFGVTLVAANNATRHKSVPEYNQVVTEWTDTHLPAYHAMFDGANAIPIPTVSVSRGVGANASATGGILSSATGGALVIETDTSEAVPGLPDSGNDYLRYSSGLVLTTRVSRFHDSRWPTEESTNIIVGDGDFAVVVPVVSYYCDVEDHSDYNSVSMVPHYLTKITLLVDEVRSDGHFVADAALPRCSLEYSELSYDSTHDYETGSSKDVSRADALDNAWSACWTGGYPSGGIPRQERDLEIVIRHPRDPYVRAVDISNGCDRTFGIDGEAAKKEAFALLGAAIACLVLFPISFVSTTKLHKRLNELQKEEEAEDPEKPPWYDQANWGAQAQAQGELPVAQPAHPVAPGGQPANAQPQV
jgi:hypothetical protein